MHLLPLILANFIRSENYDKWKVVFEAGKSLPGFYVATRMTIVDQEKSIYPVYKYVFDHEKMLLDPLHVTKNMGAKLGSSKSIGHSLYDKA